MRIARSLVSASLRRNFQADMVIMDECHHAKAAHYLRLSTRPRGRGRKSVTVVYNESNTLSVCITVE
jgi:hypothetical protein